MLVYQRTSSGSLRSHAPDLLYVPSRETSRLMIFFLVAIRGENASFSLGIFVVDMWEDGTDHVFALLMFSSCAEARRRGRRSLLLDILKAMYIKAELFLAWTVPENIHLICKNTAGVSGFHNRFCSKSEAIAVFSGNSLFSRGTTFESSTCDYSDDLQILLESGGGGRGEGGGRQKQNK